MFNAISKTALFAATAFALSFGAVGNASALSLELAPGVKLEQNCYDKKFKVTKIVHVVRYDKVIAVPKTVIVTKTVCEDYYTQVSQDPPVHYANPD